MIASSGEIDMTTYANDDAYPFLTVAYIETRFGNEWFSGSGVLVGRNDVLTASHLVYDQYYGAADEVIVHFSYDPDTNNTSYNAVYINYYTNFDPDGDGYISFGDGRPGSSLGGAELDVALLSLSTAVGDTLGWMGMDFSFTSGTVNVTGHPYVYSYYMVNDVDYVWKDTVDQTINISNLDINPGNSGGPIWYDAGNGPYVIGVVSTSSAAPSLSPHAQWLKDIINDNDKFITGGNNDSPVIYGTDGDDLFIANTSVDSYVGLAGTDTIRFNESRSHYYVAVNASGNGTVENASSHSSWSLSGIERVSFVDGTLAFDFDGNAGKVYRLYQAAFDRKPDTEGLSYWVEHQDDGLSSLNAVADSFIHSPEFVRTYGTPQTVTNAQYVELLYNHTLGRISDGEGYNYWVNKLDHNATNRGDLLAFFSESDENVARVAPDIHDGIWLVT
jgi:V8-like Glu-specific endopeptidase